MAVTYYVNASTGNDSNTTVQAQSPSTPWLTINKARLNVATGDTVNIADGTYAENSGTGYLQMSGNFVAVVTYQGLNGPSSNVVITGVSSTQTVLQTGLINNIAFKNLKFTAQSGSNGAVQLSNGLTCTGLSFTGCTFTGDSGTSLSAAFRWASNSTTPVTHNVTFTSCVFANTRANGFGFRANGLGGLSTTLTFTSCTSNVANIAFSVEQCVACTVNEGLFVGSSGYGMIFGGETVLGFSVTGVLIWGAHIASTSSHGCLLGNGVTSPTMIDCEIFDGDDTLVIKGCSGATITYCQIRGGINAAVLFKGATNATFKHNTITTTVAVFGAISNYDGDPTYLSNGNTITNNRVVCSSSGIALVWNALGEAGVSTINNNVYVLQDSASLGVVLGTTLGTSLTALRAAWTGGYSGNDSTSSTSGKVIGYRHTSTGAMLYAIIYDSFANAWNGSAFVAFAVANYDQYGIPLREIPSGSYFYTCDWLRDAAAGRYSVVILSVSAWGSQAIADTFVANVTIDWPDTATAFSISAAGVTNVAGSVASVVGAVGSVAAGGITTASFAGGTTIPRVTLADTLTTYTGNTVQTGDAYARIGAAGAGLTAIGDARMANLDAAISTRSTFAGGAVASVTGSVGSIAANGITTASFTAGTTLPRVTLVDTITTYTGNTVQTGDAFARVGAAGAGLTAIGDARMANLNATITSRMATFSLPTNFATMVIDSSGLISLSTTGVPTSSGTVGSAPTVAGFIASAGLSAVDQFYFGSSIAFTSGTLKGLARTCTSYVGSTRTFVFANPFPTAPSISDTFDIIGGA